MNIVPPLHAYGLFEVRTPYTVVRTDLYRVTALRTYEEIAAAGRDAYQLAYVPVGLTKEDMQSDRVNGAIIVTLQSMTSGPVYIPSTYIESFPGMDWVPYSHLVLSVSMGMVPDSLDITPITTMVKNVLSDRLGANVQVKHHRSQVKGSVSETTHKELEIARKAAIQVRETDYSELLAAQRRIAQLEEYVSRLEEIVTSGVEPTP